MSRRTSPGTPRGGVFAVFFVATVVVALAVVPIVMDRRAVDAQTEIAEVLDPARQLGTRLSLAQARQMSFFQAFLLTGDRQHLVPYRQGVVEEAQIFEDLQGLIGGMHLDLRGRLARLSTLSGRWHVGHQQALGSEASRETTLRELETELLRYDQLQDATLELERALQSEVNAGRRRAVSLQSLKTGITLALVVLALGATFAVGLIGRLLRDLATENDDRRRDAVRARREIDALMLATGDGVLGIDLEGRCISLNPKGAELLGYSEKELLGEDVHSILHHTAPDGELREADSSPIRESLITGGEARSATDDILWRRDGTPLPVQWSLRPLVDGTDVRGAVLTFTDVTELRDKEAALRRAVRVREEVVSVVSHDLRNPLGVVRGAAELLLELPLEEAERRKQAHIIRRSAERMGGLIENLLDMARIEAGALVVRPAAEDPAELLEDARSFFAEQAEKKGVDLRVESEEGVPHVMVDRDRIQQALANLVVNALKFTPQGGVITLAAAPATADRAVLRVRDTGPGIPREAMDHLFDRFWQASRHDRTGSGLGLAIVRGIAEAHAGEIVVESQPFQGAIFALYLPVAPQPHPGEDV